MKKTIFCQGCCKRISDKTTTSATPEDFIDIAQFGKSNIGGKLLYSFHTNCFQELTQNSNYIPCKGPLISKCEVCADPFDDSMILGQFCEIAIMRKNPAADQGFGFNFYLLFHRDCFESIAGNVLPLRNSQ